VGSPRRCRRAKRQKPIKRGRNWDQRVQETGSLNPTVPLLLPPHQKTLLQELWTISLSKF